MNVTRAVRELLDALQLDDRIPEEGVSDLVDALGQLAADAVRAVRAGIPFDLAVLDDIRHPHLAMAHSQIEYVYTLGLDDPELRDWVEDYMESGVAEAVGDELLALLLSWASDTARTIRERCLARFLAFESAYSSLLVSVLLRRGEYYALGGKRRELEEAARVSVDTMLAEYEMGVRHVLPTASLLLRAREVVVELVSEFPDRLARVEKHIAEMELHEAEVQAALEAKLADADAADIVIVRSEVAPLLGEPRRKLSRLREENPIAFTGRSYDWARQRKKRLRDRMLERGLDGIPARRHPALIDVLREALDGAHEEVER